MRSGLPLRHASTKGENKPSTQAPPPLTDAPPSTQSSTSINATPSSEAPSQALPATQTRYRLKRQRSKAPSQAQSPSTDAPPFTWAPPSSIDAPPSTRAPPSSIDAPSSSQFPTLTNEPPSTQPTLTLVDASISLIDATPSTEALSRSSPATQTFHRRCQYTKAPSQVPPRSTDPPPSTQASLPPSNAPSFSQVPLLLSDATPLTEAPSQAPSVTQTQHKSRQCTRYWTVNVKDASGVTKEAHLRLKDLWELPDGTTVVLPLNDCKQPVGEAGGLLGQALGELGADFVALPICYKSWLKVPNSYKEVMYNSQIKENFIINDSLVKKIIIKRIGEKWKDNRSEVFHRYYDPKLSKEENYANHPSNITRDQWIQFLEYRLDPNTVKMCKRNAQSREKLLVVHRGGSKTLARKRFEMEVEGGEPISRGKVFIATHAGADGSYANPATQAICDKIIRVESEGNCSQEIGPNDSLGQVLGKEPPGRLRGVGLGPCKGQVLGTQMQIHDEEGDHSSCLNISSYALMQQEIVGLRAQLEAETKSRLEFQNALSVVLQHFATPFMTPDLASILNPLLATDTSDGDAGPSNGSSDNDAF